ncbi:hypothetical protein J1614_009445 [Plenodomus biglobosus]|nr:hypothetical protein J1614_009445 [Plenodomus biglobosus]
MFDLSEWISVCSKLGFGDTELGVELALLHMVRFSTSICGERIGRHHDDGQQIVRGVMFGCWVEISDMVMIWRWVTSCRRWWFWAFKLSDDVNNMEISSSPLLLALLRDYGILQR